MKGLWAFAIMVVVLSISTALPSIGLQQGNLTMIVWGIVLVVVCSVIMGFVIKRMTTGEEPPKGKK